jgi:hypothetical protein
MVSLLASKNWLIKNNLLIAIHRNKSPGRINIFAAGAFLNFRLLRLYDKLTV